MTRHSRQANPYFDNPTRASEPAPATPRPTMEQAWTNPESGLYQPQANPN